MLNYANSLCVYRIEPCLYGIYFTEYGIYLTEYGTYVAEYGTHVTESYYTNFFRVVGAPEDWKISTLTLYRQGHWSDSQQMFRNDKGRLDEDNYGR